MTKYLVVDAGQHRDSGFKWPYEIEATSADEACKKAMERAFQDWGWEAKWHKDAPDWVVKEVGVDGPAGLFHFTSEMEYEPVFYVRKPRVEKIQ